MNRIRIYPYKMMSNSAIAIAEALKAKRVRPNGNFVPKEGDLIINWGQSQEPNWNPIGARVLNPHRAVDVAASKIASYRVFEGAGLPTVTWTQDRDIACDWLKQGKIILLRQNDRAHSGQGIHVLNPNVEEDGLGYCKITVRSKRAAFYALHQTYISEYRVHVMNGKVIDFVKKKKLSQEQMVERGWVYNQYVRNHRNGWVFARENVELPEGVADLAIKSVASLGLDFGAADVIHSKKYGNFILEVNTAPGLEGTTLERYIEGFKQYA